jgi:tRNA modification GTPase
MGVERTRSTAQKADVILILMQAGQGVVAQDQEILAELPHSIPRLRVFNKIDLCGMQPHVEKQGASVDVYVSAKTGAGLDLLRQELLTLVGWHQESGVFMARERHLRALRAARELLQQALKEAGRAELLAENLRLAQEELNSITGEFSADDLLGEIFSRFCIGK